MSLFVCCHDDSLGAGAMTAGEAAASAGALQEDDTTSAGEAAAAVAALEPLEEDGVPTTRASVRPSIEHAYTAAGAPTTSKHGAARWPSVVQIARATSRRLSLRGLSFRGGRNSALVSTPPPPVDTGQLPSAFHALKPKAFAHCEPQELPCSPASLWALLFDDRAAERMRRLHGDALAHRNVVVTRWAPHTT